MQAPCTETNPAKSGADDVDFCQLLCDRSEQCQSWMFNKDVSMIITYMHFYLHQLTLPATNLTFNIIITDKPLFKIHLPIKGAFGLVLNYYSTSQRRC